MTRGCSSDRQASVTCDCGIMEHGTQTWRCTSYPVEDAAVWYWETPAFRTAMSTRDSVCSSSSVKAFIAPKFSMSTFITLTSADSNSSRISWAATSPFSTFLTPKITLALCFTYSLADSKPIPELAPVMRTV